MSRLPLKDRLLPLYVDSVIQVVKEHRILENVTSLVGLDTLSLRGL